VEKITQHIEALIFASAQPVTVKDIQQTLVQIVGMELHEEDVQNELQRITEKYHAGDYAFELVPIAGGFQFLTKPEFQPSVAELLKNKLNRKLSTNSLETLAIIAYKQPVSKPEIEHIRGVNCDYTLQKLLDKELIIITGRAESPGKPLLYATSPLFMNYFGLSSLEELPKMKEVEQHIENSIGEISENVEIS
jgi:segregation and condensation protein B